MPYADAAGARIYYEVEGAGAPLLLIPGFGCNTSIYRANTPALARRFRAICLDPRGAGRSDSPADGYSMAVYADDCAAVLDAAGERSAHVFGTSFGGMIAQHLALLHPQRVRRIVLGCTTAGGDAHVHPPPENVEAFVTAATLPDPVAALRMRFPLNYSDAYVAENADELIAWAIADEGLRSTPEGSAGQFTAVHGHDTYDRLPRIAATTLVVHGEDDALVPVRNAEILAGRIPNARLRVFHGARHVFFVERADELNDEIIAFLSEDAG